MGAHVRRLVAVVLIAGCATGQGGHAGSVPDERLAQVRAECAEFIVLGDRSDALQAALEQGGLASLYLALRGAVEGAAVGAATGGGAGDGAWIGAAVGAGLGLIVGVVVGVRKSVEERRRYRAAVEGCVDERLGSAVHRYPNYFSGTITWMTRAARARCSASQVTSGCRRVAAVAM